jgi:hypothetical protein
MATTNLTRGQAVIDIRNFGKLIRPVEVDGGHWFYYWDRSGDGSAADKGSLNGGVDFLKQSDLIALFKQDVINSTNASGATDNTYRYGWFNDIQLAYTWNANGATIGNGSTYTLTKSEVGKTITATASYTNLAGTAESVASSTTSWVAAASGLYYGL